MQKLCVMLLGCVLLAGCAQPQPEPWELFEQIPNWDHEAEQVCCGHLEHCEEHQTPRC